MVKAIALMEDLRRRDPRNRAYRNSLALSYQGWSVSLYQDGRHDESEAAARKGITFLKELAAEDPDSSRYDQALAAGLNVLATRLLARGRLADAEALFLQALPVQERLADKWPGDPEHRSFLALLLLNFSQTYSDHNQPGKAEEMVRRALEVQEQLLGEFPTPRNREVLGEVLDGLACVLESLGRWGEVDQRRRQAREVLEPLVRAHPDLISARVALCALYYHWGQVKINQGELEEAVEWCGKAVKLAEDLSERKEDATSSRQLLSDALSRRGRALRKLGRVTDSVADLDRAIALEDRPPVLANLRIQRGLGLAAAGEHAKAFAEARAVTQGGTVPAGRLYDAACVCARAAEAAAATPDQREQYAAEAVALLRRAGEGGLWRLPVETAHIGTDPDLASLRQRDDFRRLLAELKAPTPPGSGSKNP
jgi:tetratricopeptide (TPR) repeat protein